jgi:hypothetical protein
MQAKTLFALFFIPLVHSGMFQKFNLYNTNMDQTIVKFDQWMHSCLHYYVLNDIIDYLLDTERKRVSLATIIAISSRLKESSDGFDFESTNA